MKVPAGSDGLIERGIALHFPKRDDASWHRIAQRHDPVLHELQSVRYGPYRLGESLMPASIPSPSHVGKWGARPVLARRSKLVKV